MGQHFLDRQYIVGRLMKNYLTFSDKLGPDLEEGDENAGYDEDERVYQLHIKHI